MRAQFNQLELFAQTKCARIECAWQHVILTRMTWIPFSFRRHLWISPIFMMLEFTDLQQQSLILMHMFLLSFLRSSLSLLKN